jgi:hypothetical protein
LYQQNISFLSGLCALRNVSSSVIVWALCRRAAERCP